MSTFETANLLSILAAGRVPSWTEQTAFSGAPDADDDGVDISTVESKGAIVAMIGVDLREDVHRRKAVVTATHDATSTYTVTINGTAHADATPTDLDELMTDLRDAINAGAQASAVTATALDSDGADVTVSGNPATQLQILGDNDLDWYIDISVAGGAGTIACVADPSSATMRLWSRFRAATGTTAPGSWRAILLDGTSADLSLTWVGHAERYATAWLSPLYVELDDIDGNASDGASVPYSNPAVNIGPCIKE